MANYPARFQLVLAANPCPCAPATPQDCTCGGAEKRRYQAKLSGPLLDRVDLRVEMVSVRSGAFSDEVGEPTAAVRKRVEEARTAARERWRPFGWRTNAEVPGPVLRRRFRLGAQAMAPLNLALERSMLSVRGVDRTLRVAWSLGDLSGKSSPGIEDVKTAMGFRQIGTKR